MGTVKNLSIIISKSNSFETSIPLVVVGAGACGLTAALSAREKGVEVVVIEKDKTGIGYYINGTEKVKFDLKFFYVDEYTICFAYQNPKL